MKLNVTLLFLLSFMSPAYLFPGAVFSMKLDDLKTYQADVLENYIGAVGLPTDYSFSNGKHVLPLPPISAAIDGIMIIGAYPSAVFQKGKIPVGNLKMPFDLAAKSATELDNKYLAPLGLSRNECWITNLVKVFLFKQGHSPAAGQTDTGVVGKETRSDFDLYAKKSLPWLEKELTLAKPRLIITLGEEVAGIITDTTRKQCRELLDYTVRTIKLNGQEYKIVHMFHPGLLMHKNPKVLKVHANGIKSLRPEIQKIFKKSFRKRK